MKNPIAHPRRTKANRAGPLPQRGHGAIRKFPTAFTLIEILVVISIIALLAALVVYILPAATQKKVRNRVKTELAGIETAINSYHQKRGFYPPDNPADEGQPPLYYELTGAEIDPMVTNLYGVVGILNSGAGSQNFAPNLRLSSIGTLPGSNDKATNLVVPYKGATEPNLWHYNSSNPKYNSDSFDLWAVVVISGETNIIGNWK
jgi:prepilin-type N-terminal cleavage/methylation domain-containing protein